MNWQREAEDELRSYARRKESLKNIRQRLAALQERAVSIRSALPEVAVQGRSAADALTDNLVEQEQLRRAYRCVSRLVSLSDRVLAGLNPPERLVLERFYIHRERGHIERLTQELGVEQAQVYRLKERALRQYTLAMYGITEQ